MDQQSEPVENAPELKQLGFGIVLLVAGASLITMNILANNTFGQLSSTTDWVHWFQQHESTLVWGVMSLVGGLFFIGRGAHWNPRTTDAEWEADVRKWGPRFVVVLVLVCRRSAIMGHF